MRSPPLAATLGAAAQAVATVLAGKTPDAILGSLPSDLRPAALDLAFTALRDCGRGDFLLGLLLDKPLKDKSARALLLVALSRLERRPQDGHTLVDQAVTAAGKPFKGLTNAVLRNFQRQRDALIAAAEADPVARWRHPAWWLESLRAAYPTAWEAIVAAGNSHPPMCLRLNPRHPASAGIATASSGNPEKCGDTGGTPEVQDFPGQRLDSQAFLLEKPVPVERLAGFREGRLSVQDWGAQHAARLLDTRAGQRVLDACAAPGGKTAHLLEMADLDLTALELDANRARRISENLARLGLKADVRVTDAARPQDWWNGRPFDRILADVPCTASGVVRRHPDIKWLRRPADVAGFVRTQREILDALWSTLVPGGKMLYCTCSVFPQENAEQMENFVARHPDACRLPTGGTATEMQLLPGDLHDGFYYALLEKAT